jgi:hypothetical protein
MQHHSLPFPNFAALTNSSEVRVLKQMQRTQRPTLPLLEYT